MSLRKHGLKVLGLSILAASGLMAFSASAAQAASFLENGVAIGVLKTVTGTVDTLIQLQIFATGAEIDCAKVNVAEGDLLSTALGQTPGLAHLKLLLEECKAYSFMLDVNNKITNLTLQSNCKIFETSLAKVKNENGGNMIIEGLAQVFLHTDGNAYLDLTGVGGEQILTTVFSTNCTNLPTGQKITGLTVLKLTPGSEGATWPKAVKQLAEVAGFGNAIVYVTNPVVILGSIWFELSNSAEWGIC
jgi:hypothetical protein